MFLLRDGSFTLMKIASLMFLAILLSSLPTILKLSRETSSPMMFWWSMMGDGALMYSLYLLQNVLPDSPMYSSSQSNLPHLYLYITPLFLSMVSLSLGCDPYDPSLNRNIGKFQLPHIWDEVLARSPELHLK